MTECQIDYRTAYEVVGACVRRAAAGGLRGIDITGLMLDEAAVEVTGAVLGLTGTDLTTVLDPREVVRSRDDAGRAPSRRSCGRWPRRRPPAAGSRGSSRSPAARRSTPPRTPCCGSPPSARRNHPVPSGRTRVIGRRLPDARAAGSHPLVDLAGRAEDPQGELDVEAGLAVVEVQAADLVDAAQPVGQALRVQLQVPGGLGRVAAVLEVPVQGRDEVGAVPRVVLDERAEDAFGVAVQVGGAARRDQELQDAEVVERHDGARRSGFTALSATRASCRPAAEPRRRAPPG